MFLVLKKLSVTKKKRGVMYDEEHSQVVCSYGAGKKNLRSIAGRSRDWENFSYISLVDYRGGFSLTLSIRILFRSISLDIHAHNYIYPFPAYLSFFFSKMPPVLHDHPQTRVKQAFGINWKYHKQ